MKTRSVISFVLMLSVCMSFSNAQPALQTLRGRIIDKESLSAIPLAGISVFSDSVFIIGTGSDTNGYYRIQSVPLGRYLIKANSIGYKSTILTDVIVDAGKETIVNIELEENAFNLKGVDVKGIVKEQTLNEMALVSARMFSVDETNRYAGSRSDPGRMAGNFAGVNGSNDSRNDIVIRGNSPLGVLWRINGTDVPNPNHFAVPGTTGGGVSMINSKVLDNSDFLTGAFPAEYGNTVAGVFDLRFRNGNNEKHEFTAQLGFLGTELTAEGPISTQKKSSYLFAYRYSTLKLFEAMKIKIGTDAIPNYQDLSFKINFPSPKGSLSVFGLGGLSKIDILVSTYAKPTDEIYGEKDRDQYFRTSMGLIGISKTSEINSTSYIKFSLSYQKGKANSDDFKVYRNLFYEVDSIVPRMGYAFLTGKLSALFSLNKKIKAALSMKTGIVADKLDYQLSDSLYNAAAYSFMHRLAYTGSAYLFQPYIQTNYQFSDRVSISSGLHGQWLTLNNSLSIEPRFGIRWDLKERQSINFGWGMHSQMQPFYIYYHQQENDQGSTAQLNRELSFSKSLHYVLGYDLSFKGNARIKVETYFMHLYEVPVERSRESSYSMLNEGASFSRFFPPPLENKGTGTNYGMEFTFEKFFSQSYFVMFTSSLYESKYKGSDGIERNTSFNGKYAFNLLGGKEFSLGNKHNSILSPGVKLTQAGGQRYTPVDTAASHLAGEIVEMNSQRNTKMFNDYFRLDFRISLKINSKKLTHELAFDLVNVLNTKNVLSLTYVYDPAQPALNPIREEYQLGFLPLFYYKIDF